MCQHGIQAAKPNLRINRPPTWTPSQNPDNAKKRKNAAIKGQFNTARHPKPRQARGLISFPSPCYPAPSFHSSTAPAFASHSQASHSAAITPGTSCHPKTARLTSSHYSALCAKTNLSLIQRRPDHPLFGKDTWHINTIRRVETAVFYLILFFVIFTISCFWTFSEKLTPPPGAILKVIPDFLWCLSFGILGLAFRAWQWRFDKEPKDPRKDENDVPPPLPAYLIDYPFIVFINSIAIYIILRATQEYTGFHLIAIPVGVYFGSMVKLIKFKWFQ